jgi:hypothetical protein
MSRRITTRWYIGAWVVWLLGVIALYVESRFIGNSTSPPPGVFLIYLVMFLAAFVMFAMWIAALLRLAAQRSWGWFAAVLALHLVGLGIIGMIAYALFGTDDRRTNEIVYRPRAT